MAKLTKKGEKVVRTIKTRIENLVAEGYTRSNALDKARFDNGHHPGCLSDLAIDQPIDDWGLLIQLGYAERQNKSA